MPHQALLSGLQMLRPTYGSLHFPSAQSIYAIDLNRVTDCARRLNKTRERPAKPNPSSLGPRFSGPSRVVHV
jgi:hypothetical protein